MQRNRIRQRRDTDGIMALYPWDKVFFDYMRGRVYFEGNKDSRLPEIFNRAASSSMPMATDCKIMTVLPGTPGALAGLQTGDVITSVNGETPADDINQPVFSSRLTLNSI